MKCEDMQIADLRILKQCYSIISNDFWSSHAEGLLGLGYGPLGFVRDNNTAPFPNLVRQKLIGKPMFAFSPGNNVLAPSLTLGGYDESRFRGDTTYLPLLEGHDNDKLWEVQLDALTVGSDDNKVELENTGAIFDSGTPFITLPATLADLFHKEIRAERDPLGQYIVDCDRIDHLPSLIFTLAGHDFKITADEYIFEHDDEYCASAVLGLDLNKPAVLLGNAFLQRWYAVFDLGERRVGLAEAA